MKIASILKINISQTSGEHHSQNNALAKMQKRLLALLLNLQL